MLYAGDATPTSFLGSITDAVGQAFTVGDATGWPGGDEFVALLDQGLTTREKVICTRSGNIFTTTVRGYDGTTAQNHTDSTVIHVIAADTLNKLLAVPTWQTATYQNAWVDYGTPFSPARYYKDNNGVVHLDGLVKNGTINTTIFTLPAGYRPAYTRIYNQQSNAASARLDVLGDGQVIPRNGSNAWFSIAGATFPAEA